MFDIYCLIGIAFNIAVINKSWFTSIFWSPLWTSQNLLISPPLQPICFFLFIFFGWHRSFTRSSASTMAAATWSACPPPAPAWTCSSCQSSATRTWWGTNCCMPLSPPLGSSLAEERRKWVWTKRTEEKGVKGTRRLHWCLFKWLRGGISPQNEEKAAQGQGRVGSFYHALKCLKIGGISEQKRRK